MKLLTQSSLLAICVGAAAPALGENINVGGFEVPSGPFLGTLSLFENIGTVVGQRVGGFGEATQLNGTQIEQLCSGCELTYEFSYTIASRSSTESRFSGGFINFYLGFGNQNDFNPYTSTGSVADRVAATNGQLFLTLAGHDIDAASNSFVATGLGIGSSRPIGFGAGLVDVDYTGAMFGSTAGSGALANALFDTNSVTASFGGRNADMQIASTVGTLSVPHLGECPTGPECLAGATTLRGMISAVPELQTWALMLAGLGAVGWAGRRRTAVV